MIEKPKILPYTGLITYSLILILPIFWMFITSFKTPAELYKNRTGLPEIWHGSNYTKAIEIAHIPRYFINTVIVILVVFIVGVILASMAAYIVSKVKSRHIKRIEIFFIAGLMVPIQAIVVPLYDIAIRMHATNNLFYLGIVNGAFSIPLSIVILSSFIRAIPNAIEESAIIDGCNRFQIYSLIIMPIIREGLISATILACLNAWNELMLPLLLLSKESIKTISIGMRSFFTQYGSQPTVLLAACFISMLPILVLYAVLQEKMIQGLTAGAIKG